ncbi:MAG: helix-turn-helix domain-containing protein [Pseudomonadota bacterium]
MTPRRSSRSDCPINKSLETWGDKWSLLIIRDLMFEGKRTYGDFRKSPEGIATNILASRLKKLQETGVIVSRLPQEGETVTGYALTQKGIDMLPVMLEIYLWAEKHFDIPKHVQEILDVVRSDKGAFASETVERLQKESRPHS